MKKLLMTAVLSAAASNVVAFDYNPDVSPEGRLQAKIERALERKAENQQRIINSEEFRRFVSIAAEFVITTRHISTIAGTRNHLYNDCKRKAPEVDAWTCVKIITDKSEENLRNRWRPLW